MPRPENEQLYRRYSALAALEPNVTFVGRLAQYRYYNMNQVVAGALKTANELLTSIRDRRYPRRKDGGVNRCLTHSKTPDPGRDPSQICRHLLATRCGDDTRTSMARSSGLSGP